MTLINTIEKVRLAQKEYAKFTQEKVDEIFREASLAANNARIKLAKMAVEETGMGIMESKKLQSQLELLQESFQQLTQHQQQYSKLY